MTADVTVVLDAAGLRAVVHEPWVRDAVMVYGDRVADDAQAIAPRRTGRGAASIHAEPVDEPTGWSAHVSWGGDAYYMRFQDEGTVYLPALHFMEQGLREVAEVSDGGFGTRRANAKPLKRASSKALITSKGAFNSKYYGGTKRKPRKATGT